MRYIQQKIRWAVLGCLFFMQLAAGSLLSGRVFAAATTLQPPGTCFIFQNGSTTAKIQQCSKTGYTNDNGLAITGGGGSALDPTKCYEIDIVQGSTQPSTINEVSCDDTSPTAPKQTTGNCTNVKQCDLIAKYINPLINFLSALAGVAVVISIVIGGIQYSSSGGDPQQVSAAKKRIRESLIALLAFLLLYTMLNFLIPGGLA